MSRVNDAQIAAQDEARKNSYTGMIQQTISQIPSDITPQQKAALTSATLGGIDVGYGNLRDEMLRRSAATGSTAGIPESLSEANTQAIRDKAQAGQNLNMELINLPVQRALQQASVYQPALSGMLYDRYPSQQPSLAGQIVGSALSAAGIAAACWIADALYGEGSIEARTLRIYLNGDFRSTLFGSLVMKLYVRFGRQVAARAKESKFLQSFFRPIFDFALRKAVKL